MRDGWDTGNSVRVLSTTIDGCGGGGGDGATVPVHYWGGSSLGPASSAPSLWEDGDPFHIGSDDVAEELCAQCMRR